MKWGLLENGSLGLVEESERDKILVFDEIQPSVDPNTPLIPLVMSKPVDGKTIIVNGRTKQWGHGMEQHLKVGDNPDKALKVFIDDQGFIRDSKYTFQAFDAWEHTRRPMILFPKHCDYPHQQFDLTAEGSIRLRDTAYYLGLNQARDKVIFVKKDDKNKCIFKYA